MKVFLHVLILISLAGSGLLAAEEQDVVAGGGAASKDGLKLPKLGKLFASWGQKDDSEGAREPAEIEATPAPPNGKIEKKKGLFGGNGKGIFARIGDKASERKRERDADRSEPAAKAKAKLAGRSEKESKSDDSGGVAKRGGILAGVGRLLAFGKDNDKPESDLEQPPRIATAEEEVESEAPAEGDLKPGKLVEGIAEGLRSLGKESTSPDDAVVEAESGPAILGLGRKLLVWREEASGGVDGFAATRAEAAFFQFSDEEEAARLELAANSVVRIEKPGKSWSAVKLDNGAAGLMRNSDLRGATPVEAANFPVEMRHSLPLSLVHIDLDDLPEQDADGANLPLGFGLLPALDGSFGE